MEPLKEFSEIRLFMTNPIIPKERLLNTPSTRDGMSHELEVELRVVGCEYIQSAGLLLKLPQVAMATAQILFHRFYYAKSFVKFNCYYSLIACLFLAAKIEESSRRLRDVINVFHHLRQKRKGSTITPMEYVGDEYFRMRNYVNKYERYILKELGFSVHVQHPHKLIIACLQILELEKNTALVQRAWNFMNDGLRTNIFVRHNVQTIACSCVFLAARQLQIPLPLYPAWWDLFNIQYKDMKAISLELLALYKRPKKTLHELEKQVEKVKQILLTKGDGQITCKTDGTPPSSQTGSPKVGSPVTLSVEPNLTRKSNQKSPLVQHQLKSQDSSLSEFSGNVSPVNGNKRPLSSISPPVPVTKVSKMLSCSDDEGDTIHSNSLKPIISPIKLTSGSDDEERGRSNGLPLRYRLSPRRETDIKRTKHKSHKHRSEKHRHVRGRSRSQERSRNRTKHSRRHSRERTVRERRDRYHH